MRGQVGDTERASACAFLHSSEYTPHQLGGGEGGREGGTEREIENTRARNPVGNIQLSSGTEGLPRGHSTQPFPAYFRLSQRLDDAKFDSHFITADGRI